MLICHVINISNTLTVKYDGLMMKHLMNGCFLISLFFYLVKIASNRLPA